MQFPEKRGKRLCSLLAQPLLVLGPPSERRTNERADQGEQTSDNAGDDDFAHLRGLT